jgi:dTDP-4-dehydrorhamnose 3,5-epimerase
VTEGNFAVERAWFGGVLLLRTRVFSDRRGLFYEAWRGDALEALGAAGPFVQDNHSVSRRGVVRGLHWQGPPAPQAKLVRCTGGRIFDVVVDLRGGSPDFGKWASVELAAAAEGDGAQSLLFVPAGFAHGFQALTDGAEVQYKVTAAWDPGAEGTLAWDDPELGVRWPLAAEAVLSDKDRRGRSLDEVRRAPPFRHGGEG